MMPDYEYMLWTDQSARELIASDYPWFLPVFDAYKYNIQRADAIRYFVLHKYGGVYMDLDIGCKRRLDSLLRFEAIVPKTIPVGVSNDLIFAAKGHPFMVQLMENLKRFNHNFLMPYATVMFSTGPMFVSAVYRINADLHPPVVPSTSKDPQAGFTGVRVLPKSLYGKNAKPREAPDAFFEHMYGSSWHEGDADFLIFLRIYGRWLMAFGIFMVAYGLRRYYIRSINVVVKSAISLVYSGSHQHISGPQTETPAQVPEWIRLLGSTGDESVGEARSSVPLFQWDYDKVDVPQSDVTPVNRPPSRISYEAESQPAMADHMRRKACDDTALGSYFKREETSATEPSQLPAYYVDGASAYAINETPCDPEGPNTQQLAKLRRSLNLTRLRPSWRQLSMNFKALVPPVLRKKSFSHQVEDLDKVSIEGEPLTRTISSQSDENRREFTELVQGEGSYASGFPSFEADALSCNTMLMPPISVSSPDEETGPYRRVVHRQPLLDVQRAMTPAVQPVSDDPPDH